MAFMARRLRRAGFQPRGFGYSTTRHGLERQIEGLHRFARGPDDSLPHFLAHSLGGLITLRMLTEHPQTPAGRIVLMGTPLRGSSVAGTVSRWPGGRWLLGAAERTLIGGLQAWPDGREIGMIAGTRPLGLGMLAGGTRQKSDGTVLAEESRHDELHDHVEIPATHTSMLFSAEAGRQAIAFLREGRFQR